MKKKISKNRGRASYDPEFKKQAIALVQELGSIKDAAEKLGMKGHQTLAAWARHDKKKENDSAYSELQALKEENKKLKKEMEKDKKVISILKDAAAFFCQDYQK